ETTLVKLIERLDQLGFEQAVCCLDRKGALAAQLPSAVPVWCCRKPNAKRWQRHEFQAMRVVREFRPHVIHAENCGAWLDASLAWFFAGRPGKVAFTIHGWTQTEPIRWRTAMLYRLAAKATTAMTAIAADTADAFAD